MGLVKTPGNCCQSISWAIKPKAPAASCAEQRLRALVRISRYHSGKLLRGSSARVVNMVNAGVDMADVVVGWMDGWMDESVKILTQLLMQ